MTRLLLALALCGATLCANAQPLRSPYNFSLPESQDIDTTLLGVPFEKAGSRGRVVVTSEGHLGFADGTRLRLVGTNLSWGAQFPDSAAAVAMAKRMRALGINCVRFNTFDIAWWSGGSILADGRTTLGSGLSASQMQKLDWFTHQLRENGIYYVFTFHSVWQPREGDGVRQRDSVGWGTRVPLFFDPVVQQIHRGIMRMLLEHRNAYTQLAYKDDPALAYIIVGDDAALMVYWLYTADVVRPNPGMQSSIGSAHIAHIDSLWHAWLRMKGYKTDGALNIAWTTRPISTTNMVRNGDFEDPFNASWQLGVDTEGGAQALLQFSDAEKHAGTSSGRVRIGSLGQGRYSYSINLLQRLPQLKRLGTYRLEFWAKTTPQRGSRSIIAYVYNGTVPFDWYGLNDTARLTAQWQKFSYTFTSRASDETTANIAFFLGTDSGDVFLDDVDLREVPFSGLRAGESIQNNTVSRSLVLASDVSVPRYRDNALFHYEYMKNFFATVRKFVRDTLASNVLMCPSARLATFYEMSAVADYDVFSGNDWRNSERSMLNEPFGGSVYAASQNRVKGKAFVMSHVGISYPRPYQAEMALIFPVYAGLQDWDGVFFGTWAEQPRFGASSVDSLSTWNIFDKSHVLAMLPAVSTMMRRGDISTTPREIVIDNTTEDIEQPRFHAQQAFSLSMGADPRMPLFRRVSMNPLPSATESVLPQREISALADQVDVSALDAETDEIYWDATKGTLRVASARTLAVLGSKGGSITNLPGLIVEQTTDAASTSVVLTSLTDKPVVESAASLLTIATRGLNSNTVYDAASNTVSRWGSAPFQHEGVGVRLSLTAPLFDTLFLQPVNAGGVPSGAPIVVEPRTGGRFTVLINTAEHKTPWYTLRLASRTTSVDRNATENPVTVTPNPVSGTTATVTLPLGATSLEIVSGTGEIVSKLAVIVNATSVAVQTGELPPGAYTARIRANSNVVGHCSFVVLR